MARNVGNIPEMRSVNPSKEACTLFIEQWLTSALTSIIQAASISESKDQTEDATSSEDESSPLQGTSYSFIFSGQDTHNPERHSLQFPDQERLPQSSKRQSTSHATTRHPNSSNKKPYLPLPQLQQDYDNVRKEVELAYRENEEQSLQLRNLKKTQAKYDEHFEYLEDRISYLRHKREDFKGHISHLQNDCRKRDDYIQFLTSQTREANAEKSALETKCQKLMRQVQDLSSNLTECKDDLMRLQPSSQVADNELADQYSALGQQITVWVDDRTEDTEMLENRFEEIIAPGDLPELFQDYLDARQLWMARQYSESQPMVLRYFIHRCLGDFLFNSEICCFGLDSGIAALLSDIEEGMKHLEPRRDTTTLQRWRSETLEGLLKIPALIAEQEHQAQLLSHTLYSALSAFLTNPSDSSPGSDSLHTSIVLPALNLANKLYLSPATYQFNPPFSIQNPASQASASESASAFAYEIKDSHMIDIATHKVLRPDTSVLKVAENGRIGEEVFVIAPALVRHQKVRNGKVLVCKSTVLVKLDEPMAKRGRGIQALGT